MHPAQNFNLLVATDFSDRANFALDYCAGLSKQKGYQLFLLHVYNPEINTGPKPEEVAYGNLRRKLENTIDEYSSKHLLEITGLLETGNIFTTINETTRKIPAHMLVMPLHQKVGIQNLVGRFAFRIIAASPVPVMVIPQAEGFKRFDKVLVPLDFSRTIDENVERAIGFGGQHNSTLVIFSVANTENFLPGIILKREMAIVKHRIERYGLQCETYLVQKPIVPVYRHILDFARKNNVDAILMMARRENDHDNLFVGATAGRVLENSPIPVIVYAPVVDSVAPRVISPLLRKLAQQIK